MSAQERLPEWVTADKDLYSLFGLEIGATESDISRAYRRTALKFHPDKNPDPAAHEQFQKLTEVSDILLNGTLRGEYDRIRKARVEHELRQAAKDSERRRLREDLESRERQSPSHTGNLRRRLEFLKMEGLERKQALQSKMSSRAGSRHSSKVRTTDMRRPSKDISEEELRRYYMQTIRLLRSKS
jgi:DnaJ family protein C protein 17